MAGYGCSAEEARERLRTNLAARWASGWEVEPKPGTAWKRITTSDLFTPQVQAGFQLDQDDKVFAIGSCFARNVEGALGRLGFTVESRTTDFDAMPVRSAEQHGSGYTNKYNAPAILNELGWALDPESPFPVEALQQLPNGTYLDPHATASLARADRETTLLRRSILTDVMRKIVNCRVVIITLGLIETFYDNETGLYTNTMPYPTSTPGRFSFCVLSYDDSLAALESVHELLTATGHPEFQVVVTVSPVPLAATFTGGDIVVANTHSKACLRAVADAWAQRHDNVHYFPSYEIVMNSRRETTWHMDGTHVRREVVEHVMRVFKERYVAPPPAGERGVVAAAEVS
jgi:hypothetical protein